MVYRTKGVCSSQIDVEVKDGVIELVKFTGGCNGNLKGITSLVVGMNAEEAIKKLQGIKCGMRSTSCPDQLSKALEQVLANN